MSQAAIAAASGGVIADSLSRPSLTPSKLEFEVITEPSLNSTSNPKLKAAHLKFDEDAKTMIRVAVSDAKKKGFDQDRFSRSDFLIPAALRTTIREALKEVLHGCGIVIFGSCFGPDGQSIGLEQHDIALYFLGLSSYISQIRGVQDKEGNLLGHIRDMTGWESVPKRRAAIYDRFALSPHNEPGVRILGFCVAQAVSQGGETLLASVDDVYNAMSEEHRKRLTAKEWPTYFNGNYHTMSIFSVTREGIKACFEPSRLGLDGDEFNHRCRLNSEQKSIVKILVRTILGHSVRYKLKTGQMCFLNNEKYFHGREAITGSAEEPFRHLLRLWLGVEYDPSEEDDFKTYREVIFPDEKGHYKCLRPGVVPKVCPVAEDMKVKMTKVRYHVGSSGWEE